MSLESVRAFLTANAPELSVTVTDKSSATVLLAAEALGVEPGQIAKTLSVRVGDRVVLVVTKGTARLDNKKARDALGGKPRIWGPTRSLPSPAIRSAASARSAWQRHYKSTATCR
jgi:prolyl-tRNA editing enzyme YbaK/EbsC (Cys-tRNA(Pro) deacylase)